LEEIIGFEEKTGSSRNGVAAHHPGHCNASMEFTSSIPHLLIPILLADSEDSQVSHDFGKDIFRASFRSTASLPYQFAMKTRPKGRSLLGASVGNPSTPYY